MSENISPEMGVGFAASLNMVKNKYCIIITYINCENELQST